MAIYLDTNALWRDGFDDLPWRAVLAVAHQLEQELVVPSLVVDEAAAAFRRRLTGAMAAQHAANQALESMLRYEDDRYDDQTFSATPDLDECEARWRRQLEAQVIVIETTGAHALEGLRREIAGAPPAKVRIDKKPGQGGRDAAIWATVREHHNERGEPGRFVTGDRGFWDGDGLHPRLDAEIRPAMRLHRSANELAGTLTGGTEVSVEPRALATLAAPRIAEAVETSPELVSLMWPRGFAPDEINFTVVDFRPPEVIEAHQHDNGVQLINSRWSLDVAVSYTDDAGQTVTYADPFAVRLQAQLYVDGSEVAVLGNTARSLTTMSPTGDGGWIRITQLDG